MIDTPTTKEKPKSRLNRDFVDMLRTVMLTLSIMANIAFVKMFWEFRNDYHTRSNSAISDRAAMKSNDSLTHDMLRTIIQGQITTHDIQTFQLKTIDSLTKK